eukprot:479560-Rhodomonas_salina.2
MPYPVLTHRSLYTLPMPCPALVGLSAMRPQQSKVLRQGIQSHAMRGTEQGYTVPSVRGTEGAQDKEDVLAAGKVLMSPLPPLGPLSLPPPAPFFPDTCSFWPWRFVTSQTPTGLFYGVGGGQGSKSPKLLAAVLVLTRSGWYLGSDGGPRRGRQRLGPGMRYAGMRQGLVLSSGYAICSTEIGYGATRPARSHPSSPRTLRPAPPLVSQLRAANSNANVRSPGAG